MGLYTFTLTLCIDSSSKTVQGITSQHCYHTLRLTTELVSIQSKRLTGSPLRMIQDESNEAKIFPRLFENAITEFGLKK